MERPPKTGLSNHWPLLKITDCFPHKHYCSSVLYLGCPTVTRNAERCRIPRPRFVCSRTRVGNDEGCRWFATWECNPATQAQERCRLLDVDLGPEVLTSVASEFRIQEQGARKASAAVAEQQQVQEAMQMGGGGRANGLMCKDRRPNWPVGLVTNKMKGRNMGHF